LYFYPIGINLIMLRTMPRTQKLLAEAEKWCNAEHGRRSRLAREIGAAPQAVTNWFKGRKKPTSEQTLAIQEFLKKQKS
jgi:hypothetical protein